MLNFDNKLYPDIDNDTVQSASAVLRERGLSLPDAIRIFLEKIADDGRLPFDVKLPNEETVAAIAELEAGGGKSFDSIEDFMADLYADD